jgi:hypothetical protein
VEHRETKGDVDSGYRKLFRGPQVKDADVDELEALLPNDDGDGKMLVMVYCTGCHSAAETKHNIAGRKGGNKGTWADLVDRMVIVRKAPIPREDIKAIVDYLARHFGPPLPSSGEGGPEDSQTVTP